jgi:hypothetical protein
VSASRANAVGRAYVEDEDNDLDTCLKDAFDDEERMQYMW